jgi:rubredoxin
MSKIETGGPAFPMCACCLHTSVIQQGHQWLCAKHYRFGQMRANAKRRGKVIPTVSDLESMLTRDFKCPECNRQMNWRSTEGKETVASLQHYRDGRLGIICLSCNARHAAAPGDSFSDYPKDHKYCPRCQMFKKDSEYTKDNSRSGTRRIASWCKPCKDKSVTEWKANNRDKYNEYQRAYREKRKSEGNPVTRRA